MKSKLSDVLVVFLMLILLFEFLIQKEFIFSIVSYSLNVWIQNLLPSMFPFFVVSDILVSYHIINYIPRIFKNVFCSLFKVSESVITIFFLSFLSGFPSNARIIRMMYESGEISKEEGNRALLFTHFSNPMFILSTVGVMFLHNEKYGYIILISHFLGNVIIGIATRWMNYSFHYDYTQKFCESQNFSKVFIRAIRSSIDTCLLILGTVTCFLICSSLLTYYFDFGYYGNTVIKGIMEITIGLKKLSLLSIPDIYKVVIATMFLSFGGLSVHLQVLSQIVDIDLSYHLYFVARIFHAIISGGICYLLFRLI